jgi:beta-carotene hydroxylase
VTGIDRAPCAARDAQRTAVAPAAHASTTRSAGLLGLRSRRDVQCVAYVVLVPWLAAMQWHRGFDPIAYAAMLVMAIGIGVIHHHHAHLPMWRHRRMNRAFDLALAALQGHPTYAFVATHNANHHRHRHGPEDWARTYRFAGGDTNHLWGYALHPLQAAVALYPHFLEHLRRMRRRSQGVWRWACLQYALVVALWLVVALIDWRKAVLYVAVPQALAMHWLLGANYLQHAHADGHSRWNYARNFTGAVNLLYFNIGLHTAHHEHPRMHWSRMPVVHAALRHRVDPALEERSLAWYILRVMVLAPLVPRWRSRPSMRAWTDEET